MQNNWDKLGVEIIKILKEAVKHIYIVDLINFLFNNPPTFSYDISQVVFEFLFETLNWVGRFSVWRLARQEKAIFYHYHERNLLMHSSEVITHYSSIWRTMVEGVGPC